MQERDDNEHVLKMRKYLCLETFQTKAQDEELSRYGEVLKGTFDKDRHRAKMTLNDLGGAQEYLDWSLGGSSLLVLFGQNEPGVATQESWLSPVAVDFIKDLRDNGKTLAYYICNSSSECTVVLSAIICQLLEHNPAVLRRGDDFQYMRTQLPRDREDGSLTHPSLESLCATLVRVIDLSTSPVYIVLDRPELCPGESEVVFINTLLSLVRDGKGCLRIFVVQRSELWNISDNVREIDMEGINPGMFLRIHKDQHRLR